MEKIKPMEEFKQFNFSSIISVTTDATLAMLYKQLATTQ
jgi:hypothetical protein